MDFINWAKGRELPSALKSRDGWGQIFEHYRSEDPHVHQIEPTNSCPYTCQMCPRETSMTRNIGNMDFDLFKKIIDEISGYRSPVRDKEIELFHFGESLFHPKLPQFVEYVNQAKLTSVLSINPTDLNQDLAIEILNAKPNKIIISIDSLIPERLIEIRGKRAKVDEAIKNTVFLLDTHKELQSNTEISIRIIKMNVNKDEIQEFNRFWESKGAVVEVRDFFPWTKPELKELGDSIKYPPFMPCPFPWQYVVIQWNGDVVACCRDYNGQLKLGNVRDETLKEIWNGEEYRNFREKMISGNGLDEFCKDCLSIYYTEE